MSTQKDVKSKKAKETKTAQTKHELEEFLPLPRNVQYIQGLPPDMLKELRDEGFDAHLWIGNYRNKPWRIEEKMKQGWSPIYIEGTSRDDRPNAMKQGVNVKREPLFVTTSDGYRGLWMKKKTELRMQEKRQQLEKDRRKKELSTHKGKGMQNQEVQEREALGHVVGNYNDFSDLM